MQYERFRSLAAGAALTLVVLAHPAPTAGANIDDLARGYEGRAHHSTNEFSEDIAFSIVDIEKDGTKFRGVVGAVTIQGKVTGSGKITFSGEGNQGGGTLAFQKGTGQLSASGQFIVGSFTLQLNGGMFAVAPGKYTFHVEIAP
jgi:hypothetical protein